jgi:ElaB/YqjD/DUF883 family membrane-anchored ribosome-binding protein
MSAQTGILDETGQAIAKESRDAVEPLVRYIRDQPVSAGLIILAIGFVLGKIL